MFETKQKSKFYLFCLIVLIGLLSTDCASFTRKNSYSIPNISQVCLRRTIFYAIDPSTERHQVLLIRDIMPNFSEIGIVAIEASSAMNPDVTIRLWRNMSGIGGVRCGDGRIGIYTRRANYVQVDPDCAESDNQFQVIILHEVGHWLGLKHICNIDGATTNNYCSSVGRGTAIMNPYVDRNQIPHFTDLDRAERIRACLVNNVFGG